MPGISSVEGVKLLGPLPHRAAIDQARDALCVFYPNTVYPETFGLVFAEANAVGTPVLAHPIGAAGEVLCHSDETADCANDGLVIDRVLAWRDGGRPVVQARKDFRLAMIAPQWGQVLGL